MIFDQLLLLLCASKTVSKREVNTAPRLALFSFILNSGEKHQFLASHNHKTERKKNIDKIEKKVLPQSERKRLWLTCQTKRDRNINIPSATTTTKRRRRKKKDHTFSFFFVVVVAAVLYVRVSVSGILHKSAKFDTLHRRWKQSNFGS